MYRKVTLKQLRELSRSGAAVDITSWSFDDIEKLRGAGIECIAISHGVYGMNGAEFKSRSGARYVITSRSSALFQLI